MEFLAIFPPLGQTVLISHSFQSVPIQQSRYGYGFIVHCGADNRALLNVLQMFQSLPW